MSETSKRAYEKALTFLERSARTEAEVRERLVRAGFGEDVITGTLNRLRDAALVNDEDYAVRYLEVLQSKGRGRLRIADEMRRKGLPDDIVKARIEDGFSRESETASAFKIAVRLYEQLSGRAGTETEAGSKEVIQKILQKINRKLVSLGYPYGVVGEVMTRLRAGL